MEETGCALLRRGLIRFGIPASLGLHAALLAGLGLLPATAAPPEPAALTVALVPLPPAPVPPAPIPDATTPPAPTPPPPSPPRRTAAVKAPPRAIPTAPAAATVPAPPMEPTANAAPLLPEPEPSPPAAPPAADGAIDAYARQVWEQVLAHRPATRKFVGTTLVTFHLDATGALLSAAIAESSGSALHDRAALTALRAAEPFPPPPATVPPERLRFTLPFAFR